MRMNDVTYYYKKGLRLIGKRKLRIKVPKDNLRRHSNDLRIIDMLRVAEATKRYLTEH